jgi:hypothetical protein
LAHQDTKVTIEGQNFLSQLRYDCVIGRNTSSPAVILSSRQLECVIPSGRPGIVQVFVSFCSGVFNFAIVNSILPNSVNEALPSASCLTSISRSNVFCTWSKSITGTLVAVSQKAEACRILSVSNSTGTIFCGGLSTEDVELQFEGVSVIASLNISSESDGFRVEKLFPTEFVSGQSASVTIVGSFVYDGGMLECLVGQSTFPAHAVRLNGKFSTAVVCDINRHYPGNWTLFVRSQEYLLAAGRVEFKSKFLLTLQHQNNVFYAGEELDFTLSTPLVAKEGFCKFASSQSQYNSRVVWKGPSNIKCLYPSSMSSNAADLDVSVFFFGDSEAFFVKTISFRSVPKVIRTWPDTFTHQKTLILFFQLETNLTFGYSDLSCVIKELTVQATIVSASIYSCTFSGNVLPSVSEVECVFRLRSISLYSKLLSAVSSPPYLLDIQIAIVGSSTILKVLGGRFENSQAFCCKVSGTRVDALVVSSEYAHCVLTNATFGNLSVSVSNNCIDFSNPMVFSVSPGPAVLSLFPTVHQALLPATVTVFGYNFDAKAKVLCTIRNSSLQVVANFKSRSRLECLFDAIPTGKHEVVLQDFSRSSAVSIFSDILETILTVVTNLNPRTLYSSSAATVTLFGTGFPSSTICKIDDLVEAVGIVLSDNQAVCHFERLPNFTGTFELVLAPKERNFNVSAGAVSVFKLPEIVSIVPTVYGTKHHFCPITIIGNNFAELSDLKCILGSSEAQVNVLNLNKVVCLSLCSQSGNISIELDFGGISIKGPSILFADVVRVSAVQPSVSSLSGNTVVNIFGENLDALVNPRCIFGNSIEVDATLIVKNSVLNYNTSKNASISLTDLLGSNTREVSVQCAAPSWPKKEIVSLRLLGSQGFSLNDLEYEFDAPISLTAVFPSVGVVGTSMILTLSGKGFSSNTRAKLQDLLLLDFKNFSEYVLIGRSPIIFSTGDFELSVSQDTQNYGTGPRMIFINMPVVTTVMPTSGPSAGKTVVSILGYNLPSVGKLTCKFGNVGVPAFFETNGFLYCSTPALNPGNQTFSIVVSDQIVVPSSVRLYQFLPSISIAAVVPSVGTIAGGSTVTISGSGMIKADGFFCDFAGQATAVEWISDKLVSCLVPEQRAGNVALTLVSNNLQRSNSLTFSFLNSPSVRVLLPSIGIRHGGTVVTVLGGPFVATPQLVCRFSDVVVAASKLSDESIVCKSPPSPGGLRQDVLVDFSVSLDGQKFVEGGPSFRYHKMSFSSAFPIFGSLKGGTSVLLYGENIINSPTLRCKFGVEIVVAQWLNEYQCICRAPANPSQNAEFVNFAMSVNNQDWFDVGTKFEYIQDPTIFRIEPSLGFEYGGTQVTLYGSGLVQSKQFKCRFGLFAVRPKQFKSSNVLVCETPSNAEGLVPVAVSLNSVDFIQFDVTFQYIQPFAVVNVLPSHGSVAGMTLVTVIGKNFLKFNQLSCRFGDIVVPASFSRSDSIMCRSPAESAKVVSIEVSPNGIDFTSGGILYEFDPVVTAISVTPSTGPAMLGGTLITVTTTPVLKRTYQMKCSFGSAVVEASFQSESTVFCTTPAGVTGVYAVGFSTNAIDFSDAGGAYFQFVDPISVVSISPFRASVSGDTAVFITGLGFLNETSSVCRFGDKIVPAIFLSSENLVCASPVSAPGSVVVEVSNNGVDYSSNRLIFHFVVCPAGSFCPSGETLVCPAGAMCPGNGLANFTLCTPGFYQNRVGQANCELCPLGQVCPSFGVTVPSLCPAGYICDKPGLTVGIKPCMPGHYCVPGTKSADPNDTSEPLRPIPCPAGFYCPFGAVTNISVALNFSTPQPCIPGYYCTEGSETPHGQGPCPAGFYCPTSRPGVAVTCPAGSSCPTVGKMNFDLCNPGTFNSKEAQPVCNPCPIGELARAFFNRTVSHCFTGQMCPGYGQLNPVQCPAGFVCDEPGKPIWSKQCPPGYWCSEGTRTDNASASVFPRPNPCDAGTYCTIGVNTKVSVSGLLSTPQPCVEGTYCEEACPSPQGTAQCPAGYFCPPSATAPIPTLPGTSAKRPGLSFAQNCETGTYSPIEKSQTCVACAAGHNCLPSTNSSSSQDAERLEEPTLCGPTLFRPYNPFIFQCNKCPAGTVSTKFALGDAALCEPCPEGVVCFVEGLDDPSKSTACPEGFVCGPGTTLTTQTNVKCPAGFVCSFGTSPNSMFDVPCPAGFGCPEGTPATQKTKFPCNKGENSPNLIAYTAFHGSFRFLLS